MIRITLFILALLAVNLLSGQTDSLPVPAFNQRIHFSGTKGKWEYSGQRLYKDNVLIYSDEHGYVRNDTTIHYLERTWFYPNGRKKRYIYVDFRKPNKATIIDKTFSESGDLVNVVSKKARRTPQENNPSKVNWEK